MRGGEVDAINPSPQTALSQLVHQPGLKYSSMPGFTQEHIDIQPGGRGSPLLEAAVVPAGDHAGHGPPRR